jgi:hypothetical protein
MNSKHKTAEKAYRGCEGVPTVLLNLRNKENSVSPDSPKIKKGISSGRKKQGILSPKPFRGENSNNSPCLRTQAEI